MPTTPDLFDDLLPLDPAAPEPPDDDSVLLHESAARDYLEYAIAVVKGCRTVKKADMIHNDLQPNITVDAQTYEVRIDGELITSEPADVLPMAQRYFLF